jgi:hypothetical protein
VVGEAINDFSQKVKDGRFDEKRLIETITGFKFLPFSLIDGIIEPLNKQLLVVEPHKCLPVAIHVVTLPIPQPVTPGADVVLQHLHGQSALENNFADGGGGPPGVKGVCLRDLESVDFVFASKGDGVLYELVHVHSTTVMPLNYYLVETIGVVMQIKYHVDLLRFVNGVL